MLCFGNMKYMGGDDTGEPFLLVTVPDYLTAMIAVPDENPHTIGISSIGTKKIDKKYYDSDDTIFYISRTDADDYLYKDKQLQEKATKTDMYNARYKTIVVNYADVYFYYPTFLLVSPSIGYSGVKIKGPNNEDLNMYTAEYIFET